MDTPDRDDTIRGLVDLVARLRHDVNRLTARVEAIEGTGDPEPEASAFLRRPDVAAVLREAETVTGPPASVPAPGFGVPHLREPVLVRPSAANAVGSVPRGMGGGIAFDPAYRPPVADACTDDEESNP